MKRSPARERTSRAPAITTNRDHQFARFKPRWPMVCHAENVICAAHQNP
jgi:hypothetical protein